MADTTRASSPARPQSAGGGGKTFLGQPTWLWVAGAGVVVLGYLYLKSHQTQQGQKGQGQGQHGGSGGGGSSGGPTGWTSESFQWWTRQHHNHPIKRRGA